MTVHQIAKLAKVSTATVSRVLNSPETVKPETAEVVRRVIEAIDTPGDHISEIALLKTQIKDAVSSFLYEQVKRRPMVFPVVVEV